MPPLSRHWKFRLYPTHSDKRFPRLWKAGSSFVILCVGGIFRWLLQRHKVTTLNLAESQSLRQRLYDKRDRSLISVMNHSGTWDDLCVTCLMPANRQQKSDPDYLRLTPVAADICFTGWFDCFFSLGNCVPTHRTIRDSNTGAIKVAGHGVYQESFNFLVSELNSGGRWVNILPQGRVILTSEKNQEPEVRFRWGVGRLIADAEPTPLLLPIWHEGLEVVNPSADSTLGYLRLGLKALLQSQPVTINFGEPLDFAPLVRKLRQEGASPETLRAVVTEKIQASMMRLRAQTLQLHRQRLAQQ